MIPKIVQCGNGATGFWAEFDGSKLVAPEDAKDYGLSVILTCSSEEGRITAAHKEAAAREWLRRYPEGEASRSGSTSWATRADRIAKQIAG